MPTGIADLKVPEINTFLHEPARLRLLILLSVLVRADFMFLLRQSGLSRGNLSVQMTKLEDADFVAVEKRFVDKLPRTTFSITTKGRRALSGYKRTMGEILNFVQD